MARGRRRPRKKRTILSDLAFIAFGEFLGYVLLRERVWEPFLVLLGLSIIGLWWLFFMPTYCDFLTTSTQKPCTNPVKGKTRGCPRHRRQKNDAVWGMFSLRNPGQLFRLAWGSPGEATTVTPRTGKQVTVSRRDAYETIMLVATVGGFLAGTVGAVFQGMALQ